MSMLVRAVNAAFALFGLKVVRAERSRGVEIYSPLFAARSVPDLDGLIAGARGIPGMLRDESAKFLFSLCYTQTLKGDVVEIGSWQGYSTTFLGRSVSESGNGRMYAIDHFKGNVGKEAFYRVSAPDLSDLKSRFEANIRRVNLDKTVNLLAMSNEEAVDRLRAESACVRFLFIDGDHTKEGAQKDVDLFFPLLMEGSIVVFDDCSASAPGVIEVIEGLLRKGVGKRMFTYANTAVMVL